MPTSRPDRLLICTAFLSLFVVLNGPADAAPKGWLTGPVGAVSLKGSATTSSSGRASVSGEGADIGGTSDGFQFLYQRLSGSGQITARITALDNTDGWAKAGVMIRATLSADAAHASLLMTPSNGVVFETRTTIAAPTTQTDAPGGGVPAWLRVMRRGTLLTALRSADGVVWTTVGTATMTLPNDLYIGLAVTSHRTGVLAKALFDGLALTSLPASTLAGPVAAWSFDDGAGPLARASVGALDGAITGATWTTQARHGKALAFNGVDNVVTVASASALNLSAGMTIEAWVYPTTLTGARSVSVKEGLNDLAYGLYASDLASRPQGVVNLGTGALGAAGGVALQANGWSHLATTYDGSTVRLFVNGTQAVALAAAGSLVQTSGSLRIGGNSLFGEWFQGVIDDVRIYDRALAVAEIQTDMATAVPPPPPDTTLPNVAITTPSSGATVTGTVGIAASATDNVGIASVQFLLNGANFGSAVTAPPYAVTWDTTQGANGSYTIAALARDVFGNANVSTNVAVAVNNGSLLVTGHYVQFTSADQFTVLSNGQPAITGYTLEVWRGGTDPSTSQPYATANLGKPAATTTTITVDAQTFFGTLPKAQEFFTTVTASGSGGAARSAPSNSFMMQ